MQNRTLWLAIGVVIALLLIGGIVYNASRSPSETPSPTGEVVEYHNAAYGLSFSYPDTYALTEGEDGTTLRGPYAVILTRKADLPVPANGERPPAITIDIFDNALDKQTLFGWLTGSNQSNYKLTKEPYASTTVAGNEAVAYSWSGLYEGESVAFIHAGRIYMISATSMSPTDQIRADFLNLLLSFTFSENTSAGKGATVALNQSTSGLLTTVTPVELLEDSRCPTGVQCIQAGTVRVLAEIGAQNPLTYTLVLGTPVVAGEVVVTLTKVAPEKRVNVPLNSPAYRFTFSTTKKPPAPTGNGTLRGTLSISPVCPVEQVGKPCEATPEMYQARPVLIYASDRKTYVTQVTADNEGNFSVSLPIGAYWVDVPHEAVGAVAGAPAAVRILPGETITISIAIDTGIR